MRVAFVVQRCGPEADGGSERGCLEVAQRLSGRWQVDVLTTCARDYRTWANRYPPGEERLDGVTLRRFPVAEERDPATFDRLSERLRARLGRTRLRQELRWMRAQGPWTPSLFRYLRDHRRSYDAFFFVTYLYATTYYGLPEVEERAFLVPHAHDEWPIYLHLFERMFERPRSFVFSTPEERAFLRRRFPRARLEGEVVGLGVEPPLRADPAAFRRRFGLDGPFLLYVGRIDGSKGCGELLEHYRRYRSERRSAPPLVLLGRRVAALPDVPGVVAPGFVDEQTKWDAYAASSVVLMPSPFESLSLVLLEAWTAARPVLVNGACDVLVGQVRRAQAGLWYRCYEGLALALDRLLEPRLGAELGARGRRYVRACYTWDRVIDHYAGLLGDPGALSGPGGVAYARPPARPGHRGVQ